MNSALSPVSGWWDIYYSMIFPCKYENSSLHPMYKFLMASEDDVFIPEGMESAGTMG